MKHALPPLTWLRSFEAAARHLSFSAAADELGLTQSAISQQVRSLEERLGTQLFQRQPRGLALTDDGRKLLPKVEAGLETLAAATALFDTGPTGGLLTIATSVSIAQWIIAPRIQTFQIAHPNTRVRILSTIWPDDFKSSIADVEIRFGSERQVGAGAKRLLPDKLIAVRAPNSPKRLKAQPLIETVGASDGWRSWAKQAGQRVEIDPVIHVDSYGLALDLAANGAGIALISSLLASHAVESGRVVRAHPTSIESADGYFLAVNAKSPATTAFKNWLLDTIGP